MNNALQILGEQDQLILDISSEEPIVAVQDGAEGVQIMIGSKMVTLILGREILNTKCDEWFPRLYSYSKE